MRNWQIFVSPWRPTIPTYHSLQEGEKRKAEVDLNSLLSHYSTTISSVTWTVENSGIVSTSSEATSGGVASALLSGDTSGESVVTMQATFGDGQIFEHKLLIRVTDRDTVNP